MSALKKKKKLEIAEIEFSKFIPAGTDEFKDVRQSAPEKEGEQSHFPVDVLHAPFELQVTCALQSANH